MIDLRKQLIQKGAYELLPLIDSLLLKYKFVMLSYSAITHAEENLKDKMSAIKAEKDLELETKGATSWGVNDRKRWNVDVEGFNIDIVDYVNKGVWEFLHYTRICIDMFPQIINVAVFDCDDRMHRNSVSIKNLIPKVPDNFAAYRKLLQSIYEDDCFKYISDADNYLKHVDDIRVRLRTKNLLRDLDSFVIDGFEYKSSVYDSRDVDITLEQIKEFVNDSVKALLKNLIEYEVAIKNKQNYVTNISYEAVLNGSSVEYQAYFIDLHEQYNKLEDAFSSENIFVRPITVDNDYNLYDDNEFKFETLFIRIKSNRNIIGIAKLCDHTDSGYYKKYHIEPCTNDLFESYKHNFKRNYRKTGVKNMLAYTTMIERKSL